MAKEVPGVGYALEAVVGQGLKSIEGGIGVENLQGSGLIAGDTWMIVITSGFLIYSLIGWVDWLVGLLKGFSRSFYVCCLFVDLVGCDRKIQPHLSLAGGTFRRAWIKHLCPFAGFAWSPTTIYTIE